MKWTIGDEWMRKRPNGVVLPIYVFYVGDDFVEFCTPLPYNNFLQIPKWQLITNNFDCGTSIERSYRELFGGKS